MKQRIISGFFMVPFLVVLYFGGIPLEIACIFASVVGVREFYKGFQAYNVFPSFLIGYAWIAILYIIGGNIIMPAAVEPMYIMAWLVSGVMASSLYIFRVDRRKPEDGMATMLGIIYIAFFFFHIVLVEESYHIMVWLIFFAAFGSDICAYFTGYFLGKHKMAPHLSPKKTWEGFFGGILGGTLVCGIFGLIFVKEAIIHCFIIGLIASVFSVFGDLTASAYKRSMGIKDYGKLIPGHGGIMDRFDSVLYTAPVVYYYIQFMHL